MIKMQEQMVLVLADAAAFANFDGHCPRNDIARGEILCRWGVALHEAFAFGVHEIAAFAA